MTGAGREADVEAALPGAGGAMFDLIGFLDGSVRAWGVFEDRAGRVRRRFDADLVGRHVGARFVIDEEFRFDDGAIERRQWQFERGAGGVFHATATDVVGQAVGRADAAGARMRYQFRLAVKGRSLVVDFDDRFYPIDGDRIINRATVSKFGVRLGELTILFERRSSSTTASDRDRIGRRAA